MIETVRKDIADLIGIDMMDAKIEKAIGELLQTDSDIKFDRVDFTLF